MMPLADVLAGKRSPKTPRAKPAKKAVAPGAPRKTKPAATARSLFQAAVAPVKKPRASKPRLALKFVFVVSNEETHDLLGAYASEIGANKRVWAEAANNVQGCVIRKCPVVNE